MRVVLCLIFILICSFSYSQGLGKTKAQIVNLYGEEFTECDNAPCLFYVMDKLDKLGETYESCKAFYFNKNGICTAITYLEPIRLINKWITSFQKLGYVKIDELTYKDYATGTTWELERTYVGDVSSVRVRITYESE